jgi:phosphoglycolate phosphatase-like HAD superfamily hydrolase
MKQILALDFDGVISDSAVECFWVALRTYLEISPNVGLAIAAGRIATRDDLPERGDVEACALYRDFVELMPLGNRAEDFAVILSILESGARISDQAAYDSFRCEIDDDFLGKFHQRFYEVRLTAVNREPAAWERLMGPYREFVDLLLHRPASVELAVATAKDRDSVLRLLDHYGLSGHIRGELLLDKETGVNKRSHLVELARRTQSDFSSITFVDDKINHLDSVAPLGVRCCLATWGYNGDREHQLARARGYVLCNLDNARVQLFAECQPM